MRPITTIVTLIAACLLPLGAQATPLGTSIASAKTASVASAPNFSSAIVHDSSPTCVTAVTSAPTGPATVSTKSTSFGRVLDIGSGDFAGCSLYILTSDELHTLTSGTAPFACSDNANPIGKPCDTGLWPALLTKGRPIAGPGVNRALLGTVTRDDMLSGKSVKQVTYAGLPLYRFFLDEGPGETDGANLFDPVTSPTGTWYLVKPKRGIPATGRIHMEPETVGNAKVLSVSMDNDFSLLPHGTFPVYTLSPRSAESQSRTEDGPGSACQKKCALNWPPVLSSERPVAGAGVNQHALGTIVRPDGSHQVTYKGKPLYLFVKDAYIPTVVGTQSINGSGAVTRWGVFNTISLH